jgi:hypothetical protein
MTATTLGAQPTGRAGRGRSGGDAQERAATNPGGCPSHRGISVAARE